MKTRIKRFFSSLLVGVMLLVQCGVVFAEEAMPYAGAYLEILDLQEEYRYGEEFSAVLMYYYAGSTAGAKGEVVDSKQCKISGFDSFVEQYEEQNVMITYRDARIRCVVTVLGKEENQGEYHWDFDEQKRELRVWGTGPLPDFESELPPWDEYKSQIRTITVAEGITSIGRYTFAGCTEAEVVNIESEVETIYSFAFENCHKLRFLFLPQNIRVVEPSAFAECESLEFILYHGTEDEWQNIENYDEYVERADVIYCYDAEVETHFQEEYFCGEEFWAEIVIRCYDGNIFVTDMLVEGFDSHMPGEQEVFLSFGPYQEYAWVVVQDHAEPEGIIEFRNVKTEYMPGEEFYAEVYEIIDGEEFPVDLGMCEIEGFDCWTEGDQRVTLRYNGYEEIFSVYVYSELHYDFDARTGELTIFSMGRIPEHEPGMYPWDGHRDRTRTIRIQGEIPYIPDEMFANYNLLRAVYIEANVEEISSHAFENCQLLRIISLPDSLISVGEYAFEHCYEIEKVFYKGTSERWDKIEGVHDLHREMYFKSAVVGSYLVANVKTEYAYGEEFFAEGYRINSDYTLDPIPIEEFRVDNFRNTRLGQQTVKISSDDGMATFVVYVNEPEEIFIEDVTFENAKAEYELGEEFYIEVYAHYSNGTSEQVSNFDIEGFDNQKVGEQNVIISYEGYSTTVTVWVNAPEVTIQNVLFENAKKVYEYGEDFYVEVRVLYSDGTSEFVEDFTIEGYNSQKVGTQTVKVSYGEFYSTYTIYVNPRVATITAVSFENVRLEYELGESFVVEVYAHYSDGTRKTVKDFVVEGFDSQKPGVQVVTVKYGNYSESFTVMVKEPEEPEAPEEPEIAPTVSLSDATCKAGNTVEVVVSISDNTDFANLGLEIRYDTAMTLVDVVPEAIPGATFISGQTLDTYPYNIIFDAYNGCDYNGDLVTLVFEVPEDIEPKTYEVEVHFYKGRNGDYKDGVSVNYDTNFEPLGLRYENGTITVYQYVPGDVNGDDIVDNRDGTCMLQYLAGWNLPRVNEDALDTDGNGAINNKDGTRLLRYLAGWDVTIH